jgi:hypothetical protein
VHFVVSCALLLFVSFTNTVYTGTQIIAVATKLGVGYLANTADDHPHLTNNAAIVQLRLGTHTEWPLGAVRVLKASRDIFRGEEILAAYNLARQRRQPEAYRRPSPPSSPELSPSLSLSSSSSSTSCSASSPLSSQDEVASTSPRASAVTIASLSLGSPLSSSSASSSSTSSPNGSLPSSPCAASPPSSPSSPSPRVSVVTELRASVQRHAGDGSDAKADQRQLVNLVPGTRSPPLPGAVEFPSLLTSTFQINGHGMVPVTEQHVTLLQQAKPKRKSRAKVCKSDRAGGVRGGITEKHAASGRLMMATRVCRQMLQDLPADAQWDAGSGIKTTHNLVAQLRQLQLLTQRPVALQRLRDLWLLEYPELAASLAAVSPSDSMWLHFYSKAFTAFVQKLQVNVYCPLLHSSYRFFSFRLSALHFAWPSPALWGMQAWRTAQMPHRA